MCEATSSYSRCRRMTLDFMVYLSYQNIVGAGSAPGQAPLAAASILIGCLASPDPSRLMSPPREGPQQGLAMVENAGFGGEGTIRQRALVPSRLEAFLFWSLIVLLA